MVRQCAYNNEENNSQRQNNIAKEKRKAEFSIESIILAKSNQQSKIFRAIFDLSKKIALLILLSQIKFWFLDFPN